MKRKNDIDERVAVLLCKKKSEVSAVTRVFLDEMVKALAEDSYLVIEGLGKFLVVITPWAGIPPKSIAFTPKEKIRVYFGKSIRLKEAIRKANRRKNHGEIRGQRRGGSGKTGKGSKSGLSKMRRQSQS